jgi:hypothetical protein
MNETQSIHEAIKSWRIEAYKRQIRALSDSAKDYLVKQNLEAQIRKLQ